MVTHGDIPQGRQHGEVTQGLGCVPLWGACDSRRRWQRPGMRQGEGFEGEPQAADSSAGSRSR